MFKLVIQDDEGKTTVVPLIRDEITIGRKEGNTIRLTERNVSRRHARIVRNNGEVQIEDLGSYNGIRVNNARIAERVSLRISDQVQIGDYKLYLKAEGVEQVDDARTMPIERIDSGLPTEMMPPMQANPTAPLPAITPPPTPIPGPPMPNRTPVAVADTDPAGRPVATAEQVARLTQPVGYGKLVIVSSNLAGKEFDLTRPQMIVGRTAENDIVVDHRSISRNHAKVTRDPESGRYTISDLQSSNGVRVNGQDYGKVELRRGDTVDLGHVRFQFVEPGEDFVFARDAKIADIPEGGSRKGLLVAVILGVLVLGGVGAFFVLNNQDKGSLAGGTGQTGTNTNVVATNDDTGGPNDNVAGTGEPGSAGENVGTLDNTDEPPDDAGELKVECAQYAMDKKWSDARACADRLAKLDPQTAKKLKANYNAELENELTMGRLGAAIREKNYAKAKKELAQIKADSIYRKDAESQVAQLEDTMEALYRDSAAALKRSDKCGEIDKLIKEANEKGGAKAAAAVAAQKCTATQPKDCSQRMVDNTRACKTQFCNANPDNASCTSGQTQVAPPANCDAEALKEKGMQNINMGQHAAALAQFEAALRCKPDSHLLQLAFMEACASGNSPKAKLYYKKLTPPQQVRVAQICIRQKPPVAYE
jgi:pSer/pThr/pTyr-binding forkhead associated (FHA) protein/tetratricopeptide (TPR) repeat protein